MSTIYFMLKILNCPIAALYNLLYVLSKWCALTTDVASDVHEEDVLKVFDDNHCSGLHISCNPFASIYCSSWKQYCQYGVHYVLGWVGVGRVEATERAHELSHSLVVHFHMRLQRHQLHEAPVAHRTGVRFLASVPHHVVLERPFLAEGAAALRAHIRLVAAMHFEDVPLHGGYTIHEHEERESNLRTLPHKSFSRTERQSSSTFSIEHRRALGARPRHLAIVVGHMIVQLRLGAHARRAHRTREVPDVVVPHHVYLERILNVEAFLADVALVRVLLDVHVRLHVLHQVRPRLERLATHLTDALHALLDAQMDAIDVLVDRPAILVVFAAVGVLADEALLLGGVRSLRFHLAAVAAAAVAVLPVAMSLQFAVLIELLFAGETRERLQAAVRAQMALDEVLVGELLAAQVAYISGRIDRFAARTIVGALGGFIGIDVRIAVVVVPIEMSIVLLWLTAIDTI